MPATSLQPPSTPSAAAPGRPRLAICTALTATPGVRAGSFVLTRKFLDGVMEYARHWPGSISVCIERADRPDSNLDHVEVGADDVPFHLRWIESNDRPQRFASAIATADLVLAALVDKHVCLADLCHLHGVPLVYISEYSVKTREQIVRAESRNPVLRWRRTRWARRMEKQYRAAVALARGVQCNGLPTYNAYQSLNDRALLYFDTRVRAGQLAPRETLDRRLATMQSGHAIRLAFSGRLIAMKGADHLPAVARELKRLNVPFTMDICGGGNLEATMKTDVSRFGLNDCVRMRGVLDFERELLPLVAREIDLFVCCHRQGDPSCTYLETYSCGVPIVGYDNEAFAGLAKVSNVGGASWVTPIDDPVTLARRIADLNRQRDAIAAASHNALAFAAQHTFENTMRQRVQHMLGCLNDHDRMRGHLGESSQRVS